MYSLLLLAAVCSASSAPAFFISPNGSDSNPGTSASAPLATFSAAQLAMRAALAAGPLQAEATVTAAPGMYIQSSPLLFNGSDSGTGGFRVNWQCAGAVLYIGVRVPEWQPLNGSGPIWVANVSGLLPPLPPVPPPPPPPAGCGLVEPGISYNGNDITTTLVNAPNNISACCQACSAQPGCKFWSLCVNITCGTPSNPVNCYLKTSDSGRTPFGPLRTSGSLPPAPTPTPAPPRRFFTLLEGSQGATLARLPNRGSGYLTSLGISNSDSSLSWGAGNAFMPNASFDVSNAHVFCNLGADWFTETRPVLGLDIASRSLSFEAARNGVAGCNNKAYLQGALPFLDEPGEWVLLPSSGQLFYWPWDTESLQPGSATPIVAATAAAAVDFRGSSSSQPVQGISIQGLELRGSDFTPDGAYRVFPAGRSNDTPAPTNTGMVRLENAANISLLGCRLLQAGLSAVFLQGWAQNITVEGCWIEGAGFCGVATNGPYPGDGPATSAEEAFTNKGHSISSNLLYDLGKRVGHGAGVWLFQTGLTVIERNYIKEVPRNGVGLYGQRFGTLPPTAYGVTLDFFSGLQLITTRNNTVRFNRLENVVRDSCDAGAVETWGVGIGNVFHTNSVSDCDSGGVDGSWMNFLFQDDASHWLNHSFNVVFSVSGKGAEEGTMIKSISSVSENNIFAYSTLGFLANIQPYIEPAAAMTFARNIFAHLAPQNGGTLEYSLNAYTAGTLATSCSNMNSPAVAARYNFTNFSTPALSTPVILEFDHNLYFNASHAAVPQGSGWDSHSVKADPMFVGSASVTPWSRTAADLALQPGSPAFGLPGFRRIAVEEIGLGAAFTMDLSTWARRRQGTKIQAETYDRMQGLWREGSYAISPGPGGFAFAPGAWAVFRRCDLANATVLRIRLQPMDAARTVSLALGSPDNVLATFSAAESSAPAGSFGVYEVLLGEQVSVSGGELFLLPNGNCIIDWFSVV